MFTKIIAIIIVAIAIFAGFAAMQPDEFKVSRSLEISAPASKIFDQVNELKNWDSWSPWAKLDPNAKSSFEGPISGVGAAMLWDGNNQVGKGSMTIDKSTKNELVHFQMKFLKPMESTSEAEFTFKTQDDSTVVTWSMYGQNNFIGKAMSLIFNCEKMVGGKFEEGLANLKAVVEKK